MRALLLAPLLLASCAPLYGVVQGDRATLRVEAQAVVFANPGPDVARLPSLLIRDAASADPLCSRLDARTVACKLPDVPAGQQYRLVTDTRPTAASVTFYRAGSGDRPVYLRVP